MTWCGGSERKRQGGRPELRLSVRAGEEAASEFAKPSAFDRVRTEGSSPPAELIPSSSSSHTMAKRPRHAPPPRQTRTRTRQHKSTLAGDPTTNTEQLNTQLRELGLYPASTLGDGNCLFRALSDQFYGSPSQHSKLRDEICNWMEAHKARYAPFCDDERGLDVHLRCMRQPGTYGGHLELTAFAHLKRRDVKVIQPGLVYVIEWMSGADLSPTLAHAEPYSDDEEKDEHQPLREREARKTRRERKKEMRARAKQQQAAMEMMDDEDESSSSLGAVYVAYHDWEHFSSVRNLTGPHAGLPYVVEKPATMTQAKATRSQAHASGSTSANKSRGRANAESQSSAQSSTDDSSSLTDPDEDLEPDAEQEAEPIPEEDSQTTEDQQRLLSSLAVPLPMSRTPSPPPSSETSASQSASVSESSQPGLPLLPGYNCPSDYARLRLRMSATGSGSPKRAYDNADEAAEDSQGEAKRSRRNSLVGPSSKPNSRLGGIKVPSGRTRATEIELENDNDVDADTPDLLSSAESSSNDHSSSPATTPPPLTVVVPPTPSLPSAVLSPSSPKSLTKRERKRLRLPKEHGRSGSIGNVPVGGGRSAGKIKVPGGKFKKAGSAAQSTITNASENAEAAWMTNGSGRVDVRGFKELKI